MESIKAMSGNGMQQARAAYTEHNTQIDHIAIIRHIEAGLLRDMTQQGYGRTQLQEALSARSRYPKDEGQDARSSYFESILPTTEEEGDAALPSPAAVFERAYPARVEEHAAHLHKQDVYVLAGLLREGHAPGDLQEAYFGHSLFRHLLGEEKERNRFESDVLTTLMEREQ